MRNLRTGAAALAIAVAALAAVEVKAAPADPKQVPADAKWVAHVDVDAMRTSSLVQRAWNEAAKHDKNAESNLDNAGKLWGLDFRSDLHGITVFSKVIGEHRGVMIVDAKVDPKHLEELAAKAPDHKTAEFGSHKLHSWTDHGRTVWGSLLGEKGIVFASGEDELKNALDVIDGKADSLGSRMEQEHKLPAGTIVAGYVRGLNESDKVPAEMALVKKTVSHFFLLGENDGQVFYVGRSEMTGDDVVGLVADMLRGARAFAMLHVGQDEAGKKLVEAFQMKTDGKTITVTARAPVDTVWDQVVKHARIIAERRAKHDAK